MAETGWFYTKGDQRHGPIKREELAAMAQAGQLSRDDMVWTIGMNKWAAAGTVSNLFKTDAPPATIPSPATIPPPAAEAPASADTLAYYTPSGTMPARAIGALAGYGRPMGDTYDWPLDDARVLLWEQTVKLRKKISSAAQLYRALLLLSIIAAISFGIIALFTLAASSGRGRGDLTAMTIFFTFMAGLGVLYFFAVRATMHCARWAPLTMFILFMLGVAVNVFAIVMASTTRNAPEAVIGGIIGMILPAICAFVSWRAFSAIPDYLRQPAWCQELVLKAKL